MKKIISLLLTFVMTVSLVSCSGDFGSLINSLLNKNQLSYELSQSGTEYTVTGIGDYKGTDVVIPEKHKGLPVTAISGPQHNHDITSVKIPKP